MGRENQALIQYKLNIDRPFSQKNIHLFIKRLHIALTLTDR